MNPSRTSTAEPHRVARPPAPVQPEPARWARVVVGLPDRIVMLLFWCALVVSVSRAPLAVPAARRAPAARRRRRVDVAVHPRGAPGHPRAPRVVVRRARCGRGVARREPPLRVHVHHRVARPGLPHPRGPVALRSRLPRHPGRRRGDRPARDPGPHGRDRCLRPRRRTRCRCRAPSCCPGCSAWRAGRAASRPCCAPTCSSEPSGSSPCSRWGAGSSGPRSRWSPSSPWRSRCRWSSSRAPPTPSRSPWPWCSAVSRWRGRRSRRGRRRAT